MNEIKKFSVVIPLDDPSPIAYLNVYEEGDVWIKIKGCEACLLETRKICCGNCPMFTSKGCFLHLDPGSNKPFHCVAMLYPNTYISYCSLEFKCVEGSKAGQVRRIKDTGDVFR